MNFGLTELFKGLFQVVQRCFDHCIDDFTSKSLTSREDACISRCAEKMNNSMTRLAMRYQEANELAVKTGSFSGV
jgi:mitochondrial import inner membrane translocase subunit TIM9